MLFEQNNGKVGKKWHFLGKIEISVWQNNCSLVVSQSFTLILHHLGQFKLLAIFLLTFIQGISQATEFLQLKLELSKISEELDAYCE